jgi:hypothetical protein
MYPTVIPARDCMNAEGSNAGAVADNPLRTNGAQVKDTV